MVDGPVVRSIREYLTTLQRNGFPVSFAVVFGSHSKGTARQWSDIDVLVVSPRFDQPCIREDVDRLWELAARTDGRIEPIPCGERQWEEDDSSAIIEIARRDGEHITLRP